MTLAACCAAAALAAPAGPAPGQAPGPTDEQAAFFEKKIRPVLAAQCYGCHSGKVKEPKGGLALDTPAAIRRGGASGPLLVPGRPEESLLVRALRHEGLKMPPGKPLPAGAIADFEQWIRTGAAVPAAPAPSQGIDLEQGRRFWAFQPPRLSPPPVVRDTAWPRGDVDRYVLAALEAKELRPVGEADRGAWLRRVTFDLTGLPPAPEEADAFRADRSPDADGKVVDRLLASPAYGERWGRHWLDVARFAESSGKEQNVLYPHAWRYREWVIRSFNADKPYDRFLREQIAGDRLPAGSPTERAELQVATGYLALGPKSHNTPNPLQFRADLADEQIDAVSQGMLGLTVACARCHDHKFDPIPTRDYYALAGIFMSTQTLFGGVPAAQTRQVSPLVEIPDQAEAATGPRLLPRERAALQLQIDGLRRERQALLQEARQKPEGGTARGNPRLLFTGARISILERTLENFHEDGTARRLAMGAQDWGRTGDMPLLQRGELDRAGPKVPRGFLTVMTDGPAPGIKKGSGRLELAEWIASPRNPLTARVMVNRVWLHLFGRGLVPTPNNFGVTGQPPTHPELLDYLALRFVEGGWSVKKLVRELVLSRTYRLASTHDARAYAADPDGALYWRMPKRRLEAEAIRDAMLAASGDLDRSAVPYTVVSRFDGPAQPLIRSGALNAESRQRSVYLPVVRDQVSEALAVFDFAEPSLVVGEREDTTVPSQALFLMNSPFVLGQSEKMAERLLRESASEAERVSLAFRLALGREPSAGEREAAGTFFRRFPPPADASGPDAVRAPWAAFCQALFASAEFRYLN